LPGVIEGGVNPFDIISALESIREARKNARHVLFILHGGLGYMRYPSPESVRTLRYLAEQGLTAIVRHHSHSVQGYERWKGVPIYYSLGNFIFNWHGRVLEESWYEGIMVRLQIDENNNCSHAALPLEQPRTEPGVRMLQGTRKDDYLVRLAEWSAVLSDEKTLSKMWSESLRTRNASYLGLLTGSNRFTMRIVRRLGLLRILGPNRAKRLILQNLMRCDAHREALLDLLDSER
jgi:hypothetical protein